MKITKPNVLRDITSRRSNSFSESPRRLNLLFGKVFRVRLTAVSKVAILSAAALFFFLGSVVAPTLRAAGTANDDERQALEAQLAQLEGQINVYENQVTGYQQQGKTLSGEISILNGKIAKLNLQIQAINLTLAQLNQKISDTQTQIVTTQSDIDAKKSALVGLFNSLYENEQASLMEIFLKNPHLSDFFIDLNNVTLTQSNLRIAIQEITDLRNQLKDKQDQFAAAKADAETAQAYQNSQKAAIASTKDEKNQLLAATKGQESKYQTLLAQTKATAAQIRSRIFQLLGGGELSFEDAYKYAKLAGDATGIRPALILAVLDRESALGQNVGKCSYKTAMSPANQPFFLQITSALNINPNVVTVSCPNKDGTYGGAMGPAQFVPSTWNLYAAAIAKISGSNPPSPWSNADAFVATALYLKDAMGACAPLYSSQASEERCVAAKYYAGGRWPSYLWTYGEAVVTRANGFQDDIDTITG